MSEEPREKRREGEGGRSRRSRRNQILITRRGRAVGRVKLLQREAKRPVDEEIHRNVQLGDSRSWRVGQKGRRGGRGEATGERSMT